MHRWTKVLGHVRSAELPRQKYDGLLHRLQLHDPSTQCSTVAIMSHDATHKVGRLRNLALLFERGELDREFAAADVSIADMRETVARRIRQLAEAIEGGR